MLLLSFVANGLFDYRSDGRVTEQGTHDELLANKGTYYEAVQMQNIGQESENQSGEHVPFDEDIVASGVSYPTEKAKRSSFAKPETSAGDGSADTKTRSQNEYSTWTLSRRLAVMMGPKEWVCVALGLASMCFPSVVSRRTRTNLT